MNQHVRFPRFVGFIRVMVYSAALLATVMLIGLSLSLLGFMTVFGAASLLLFGEASASILLAVVVLGLLSFLSVELVLVTAARRFDQFVLQTARIPTPIEKITAKYVAGDIDERELERQLERVLIHEQATANATTTTRTGKNGANRRSKTEPRAVEIDVSTNVS